MNENNIGGNNSTTNQNAYEKQKEISRNNNFINNNVKGGMNQGAANLGKTVGKTLTASGHPVLGLAAKGAGKVIQNRTAKKIEEINEEAMSNSSEVGANENQKTNAVSRAAGGLTSLAAGAGSAYSKVKKARLAIKLAPIIGGVSLFILTIVLIASLISMATSFLGETVDSLANLISGNGYHTTKDSIKNIIDSIKNDSNVVDFDDGILYATINEGVLIDPEAYELEEIDENSNAYSEAKAADPEKFDVSKDESWSFYQVRQTMLGNTDKPGTMIYNLIGLKFDFECSDSRINNISAFTAWTKYFANALWTGGSIILPGNATTNNAGENLAAIAGKITFIDPIVTEIQNMIAFDDQNLSYLGYTGSKLRNIYGSDSAIAALEADVKAFVNGYNNMKTTCGTGKYVNVKTVKTNDYDQYFNYIANVFVPTIYNYSNNNYTEERKQQLLRDTVDNIVTARNDYYYNRGESNYLNYMYDVNGKIIASASDTPMGYISNFSLDKARSEASGFKQYKGGWEKIQLGNSTCSYNGNPCDIHHIGCYVTSIAIIMANSGTQINSPTFDPGVLANHLKSTNSFSSGGGLNHTYWSALAPNFKFHSSEESWRGLSKSAITAKVMEFLNQGYHVILHVKSGGHFVAVIGVENGRILIGDPAKGATPVYFDSTSYPEHTITGYRLFTASDV